MVFACQLDSFQKSLTTAVKSCVKTISDTENYYEVICEDSIFFPEGGGQPWDTGYINNIPVFKVLRRESEAVLHVKEPIEIGKEVNQVINWERRFDHMQQHSGQHLITSIINLIYKVETTSWWLGEKLSFIELETKEFTKEQKAHTEMLVNEKIIQQIPVNVKLYDNSDEALQNARTRGLPKDVAGPIRCVEILGLESDLCCGTHVNNLSQLQCIKLLHAEKGKKNKTNLFFLVGGRVLKNFTDSLNRESNLTKLLKCEPDSHVPLVQKLQQNLKTTNKKFTSVLKELAVLEAEKYQCIHPQPSYYCHYNKNADSDYLNFFLRAVKSNGNNDKTFFMLAAGEENGNGNLLLQGNPENIEVLGSKITELLCGKGTGQKNRFQAKVSKLANFEKAVNLVKEYFDQHEK